VVGLRPNIANITGNNPKDRFGLAKVPFSLIPSTSLVLMAMGLKIGARKYGPFNWRVESVQGRIYLEAALRHLLLLLDGEDYDRDTGLHHGAFVLSTMAIFIDTLVHGRQIDNRALPGRTGDLVHFFNDMPGSEKSPTQLIQGFKALLPTRLLGSPLAPSAPRKTTITARDNRHPKSKVKHARRTT
jgi:hypothetical protein